MLKEPLFSKLGIDNIDSNTFQQILDGRFECPETCEPITKWLLQQLARPEGVNDHPPRTYQEYRQGWLKARETTVSSPSGIHFGHYMAAMADETVARLNAILANLALYSGTAPDRWKKTLNVMLEKMAGNNNVKKLRIIMLFEADFNNNNKWIGRQVMKTAEASGLLAPEQYGSRKRKAAGTQCLNKWLFYDLYRSLRALTALCSNDAKSCYDRIVLIIAALCLCRLGATKEAAKSMISTLVNLRHHVRMAFGDSTHNQGQINWDLPTAGIGQGNGARPQIWAAVSSPLFEIM